jgi:competence protein ComEC
MSWPTVIGAYLLMLAGWVFLRHWPREGNLAGLRVRIGWSASAIFAVGLLAYLAWGPPSPLRVTFLDVGQGDCTLIQTPEGHNVLIDAGGRYESGAAVASDTGQRVVLPALRRAGVRRLDVVILTHPHEDHAGGLPAVFAALPVGLWLDSGQIHAAPGYHGAHLLARQRQIPFRLGRTGDALELEPGVRIDVVAPSRPLLYGTRDDLNNNSIVCRLQYGETAYLFAGDSEFEEEGRMLHERAALKADVLKVGHHGSATSSGSGFLSAVSPRWAIVSCGRHNRYGHPAPGTISRLQTAGARVFRTDLDGGIVAESDGHSITFSTSRWQLP